VSAPTRPMDLGGQIRPGEADTDSDARNLIAELREMGLQVELQAGLAVVHPIDTLDLEARALVASLSQAMVRVIAAECADQLPTELEPMRPMRQRLCGHCQHLLRRASCAEPVQAGLVQPDAGYGIAWPTHWRAGECPAFEQR